MKETISFDVPPVRKPRMSAFLSAHKTHLFLSITNEDMPNEPDSEAIFEFSPEHIKKIRAFIDHHYPQE